MHTHTHKQPHLSTSSAAVNTRCRHAHTCATRPRSCAHPCCCSPICPHHQQQITLDAHTHTCATRPHGCAHPCCCSRCCALRRLPVLGALPVTVRTAEGPVAGAAALAAEAHGQVEAARAATQRVEVVGAVTRGTLDGGAGRAAACLRKANDRAGTAAEGAQQRQGVHSDSLGERYTT
jgi:hypothetical protein